MLPNFDSSSKANGIGDARYIIRDNNGVTLVEAWNLLGKLMLMAELYTPYGWELEDLLHSLWAHRIWMKETHK